jgi:hypothetical protein
MPQGSYVEPGAHFASRATPRGRGWSAWDPYTQVRWKCPRQSSAALPGEGILPHEGTADYGQPRPPEVLMAR